jgi:hypothetical protein
VETRAKTVYRSEVVGSMLRPHELVEARSAFREGRLGEAEYRAVEDTAVDAALRIQEEAGVIARSGYEDIAREVFKRATRFDVFHMEYDDERSGSFEPLRYLPDPARAARRGDAVRVRLGRGDGGAAEDHDADAGRQAPSRRRDGACGVGLTEEHTMARRAHLVGAWPGRGPERAMDMALNRLGPYLDRMTDGETGDRHLWVTPSMEKFRANPDVEIVRDGDWSDYEHVGVWRVRETATLLGDAMPAAAG